MHAPETPGARHQRLKALFCAALDLAAEARPAFVDQVERDQPDLAADLRALLDAHLAEPDYLEQDPHAYAALTPAETPAFADDALPEGARLGPYRIVRQIGRGGMGAVYLAERDDAQYERRVAIKVVRSGAAGDDVAFRFRQERQILAALGHEHIATLLDGGTTDRGQPYLVMEFVEGTPIDRYCESYGLDVTDRLQLFRAVCAAVQFAHQHLVIHRDLKPGNVLVTAAGVPKLLDFGIAKLIDPARLAAPALATRHEVRLMTPEYASPEQARGEHLTAASDVYALGVMLFELLTGQRPYTVANLPLHEVTRVICEQEPPRPSTFVRRAATTAVASDAATRPTAGSADRLSRRLAGDLDTIVLKALAKDPARRYASVEQLSEDLRRHLDGLPVTARPDTFGYRAGKFVRRHRGSVSAAALLLLTLIAGVVATAWQARVAAVERDRAQRRFAEVRQLATSFLFEFHDAVVTLPGSTPARQLVVKRALQHLEGLAAEAAGDVDLQRELASAYLRVGDVQGNPYRANLGRPDEALTSYQAALRILEMLTTRAPDAIAVQRELAASHERIGDARAVLSDVGAALASQRQALEIRERLRDRYDEADAELATSYYKVGESLGWAGDLANALAMSDSSLGLRTRLADTNPTDITAVLAVATSSTKVGELLLNSDPAGALLRFRESQKRSAAALAIDPVNARARRALAISHGKIAEALAATGDAAGAIRENRTALDLREALLSADPTNAQAKRELAISYSMAGAQAGSTGAGVEARRGLARALELFEELFAANPQNALARADLVIAYRMSGAQMAATDSAAAIERLARAWTLAEALASADASDNEIRREMVVIAKTLGDVWTTRAREARGGLSTDRWQRAKSHYDTAISLADQLRASGALPADDADLAQIRTGLERAASALAGRR